MLLFNNQRQQEKKIRANQQNKDKYTTWFLFFAMCVANSVYFYDWYIYDDTFTTHIHVLRV